ncbi:MAG: IS200/IS605 family transposase [Bacteroidetes bacterium]|nr:IS200/IS605 family transposase [Bacteroidota bacterium]
MAQTLVKNYLHIVFSTKGRAPFIHPSIENELHFYMTGICTELGCYPIKIGGYNNHVHILCNLSKRITLAAFMEKLKGNSSKWIKTKGHEFRNFYWQGGYAAFSVAESDLQRLIKYLNNQHEHHEKATFKEEYISFLEKYEVDYDERYLWD